MTTVNLAGIDAAGCLVALSAPPGPGYMPYFNGTDVVWIPCDCSGSGGSDPGCCIQSAAVNAAGHLILTMVDGTIKDAGSVVGSASLPAGTADQILVNNGTTWAATNPALVPFRLAGAAGADGALAQPNSNDSVATTAAVQHQGDMLVGGAVGDLPLDKMQVSGGDLRIDDTVPELKLERSADGTLYNWRHDKPSCYDNAAMQAIPQNAAGVDDEVTFEIDTQGNFGNNKVLAQPVNDAMHVQFFMDKPGTVMQTQPPTVSPSPWHTSHWTIYVEGWIP